MKRFRVLKSLLLILLVLIVFSVTLDGWLPKIGTVLTVPDHIKKSDAVVVLQGKSYFRFLKAAELVKSGMADRIVISLVPEPEEIENEAYLFYLSVFGFDELTQRDYVLKVFEALGIPNDKIEFTPGMATATYEEAALSRLLFDLKGYRTMILVTDPYHMRRALFIFSQLFKDSGVAIFNATAENSLFDPEHWWRKERDVKRVGLEYLSFAHNLLYRFLLKVPRTAFDNP
ncbi:YdcF family protein [Omnitrophica bacterium]|nr:YdcF family protein [Candidatus Omnitrophota bacterium]